MLQLAREQIIGAGGSRFTFQHPDDRTLCVKVDREGHYRPETPREAAYYARLKRARGQSRFDSIANFHGLMDTNLGEGGVYDLVRNETDDKQAMNLVDFVAHHGLAKTKLRLRGALDRFNRRIVEEAVVVIDIHPRNFCVRELRSGHLQIVAIDGMGHRDYLPLCEYWPWFGRRKTRRYAERFSMTCLEGLLAREHLGYEAKPGEMPRQLRRAA